MPRASVLIPTHEHAATLPFSVASVQAQNYQDMEILIVGDGVGDTLRAAVKRLQADDSRIKFFDFPKGPRNGEIHRDVVLRQAQGQIVCYQSDDDLWLPGHLHAMQTALESADFVTAMQVLAGTDGKLRAYYFDLESPQFVVPWLAWDYEPIHLLGDWATPGVGLSFCAHRLDAYLRLPEGWTTTPDGRPSDQFMWKKFARQPWCRLKSLHWPLTLQFPAKDRRDWAPQQRADELARWTEIIASPDGTTRICHEILGELKGRLLHSSVHDAILNSTTWRLTAPLRRPAHVLKGLIARWRA
jgi:glycosyltransferase involved in cell wall biosynthesis